MLKSSLNVNLRHGSGSSIMFSGNDKKPSAAFVNADGYNRVYDT